MHCGLVPKLYNEVIDILEAGLDSK
uniref:Uncharacterized protein n=1 Tax=Arundo donax TaxID=35708 RepID=A0A0A8Z7R9_ARUDO